MKTYRIACIPGDGIGKEVIPAGREVLEALAATQSHFPGSSSKILIGAATIIASTA